MFVNSGKLEGAEAEPKLLRAKLKILIEGERIILLAEYKGSFKIMFLDMFRAFLGLSLNQMDLFKLK